MDKLEEHIRQNRKDLDRYTPPDRVWSRISREIKPVRFLNARWISTAAMIAVILGIAVIFFRPEFRWKRNSDISQSHPQLKETEIYYNNLVNTLYKEALPLLVRNPEIKKELNTDLSQIDSIYADLKKDLRDNISNEEVVEALIQNYRIKISILEDMLNVLKENENNPVKTKSHEL